MASLAEAIEPSPGTSPDRRVRHARAAAPAPLPSGQSKAARSLESLVAGEIIPRLMMAHGMAAATGARTVEVDLAVFTPLALEGDARALFDHVDRLLARGVPVDSVMVDLLAPAARMLGEWWEEDRCDFVAVTMGLWRLQEVVRDLAQRAAACPPRRGRRALFSAFPGEQHDFGTAMVSDIFHRHGWESEILIGAEMGGLLAEAARRDYDLIGLTVSCDCHSARLPSAILALRSVSRNPHVRVMIGGRVVNEDCGLADHVGADGTATDARQALEVAERLVDAATRDLAVCG